MKNTLTAALGILSAGVVSAAPIANEGDDTDSKGSFVVGETEPETMLGESQLLSDFSILYADDDITVTWGGRVFADMGWFHRESDYPSGTEDGMEIRTARFFTKAKIFGTVETKVQIDFGNDDANFKDVYLAYPTPVGKVIVGNQKQPMSLEALTSSRHITFMERAAPVEAITPSRDLGIATAGAIGEDSQWAFGIFKRGDEDAGAQGDGEYAYTGRLTHAFENEENLIHVGGSASYVSGQDVRFRTRPEAHLLDRTLDTTTADSNHTWIYGGEAAWVHGPFSAQGEYLMASIDDFEGPGKTNPDIGGFYAYLSYFLTGESRPYKGGKFQRIKPMENWTGEGITGGAWEAAARVSYTDFDDVDQGEMWNLTGGVNWYLNPNARIMFNYVFSNVDSNDRDINDKNMDAFMIRFQADW